MEGRRRRGRHRLRLGGLREERFGGSGRSVENEREGWGWGVETGVGDNSETG